MPERDPAVLRRHFDIERELADRLRAASPAERQSLYAVVYDELFRRVPDHPQHTRKAEPTRQAADMRRQLRLLQHFMTDATVYLEIGAGDGFLTREVARRVKHAYAVDVSQIIADADSLPTNCTRMIVSGMKLDIASESVDLAYSNQFVEHLHPEDAVDHLREVARTLRRGGRYVIITPHRYSGPHDISRYFSNEPQGFHLHEYSYGEMIERLRASGFAGREAWTGIKGHFFRLPLFLLLGVEKVLGLLPRGWCRWLASSRLLRVVVGSVVVVGIVAM
jgi:SAM-dependent methyltransferase